MTGIWQRIRGTKRADLTCVELVELVSEYLEGTLGDAERMRFEEHVRACRGCSNYLEQLRETIAVVGRIETEDLSDEAKSELLAAFRGWNRDAAAPR